MSQIKIWLDNYTGQYLSGAEIRGKVVCTFDSETSLRGVKIRIRGEEHTEWLGDETYFDSNENRELTRQVLYTGDNEFLSHQVMLFGNESGSTTLPSGQHAYPFTFTLPQALPSSYACQLGSIIYKLKAIVDRPMRNDYEDVVLLNVTSPIDFSRLGPDVMQPSSYSDDKTICCLCCASGPISMDAELSKLAIVPGETVDLTVRLTNMSNVNVEGVNLEFKQVFKYFVYQPSQNDKVEETVLYTISNVGVGAHADFVYELKVELPPTIIVPNFDQCKLFKVDYTLNLEGVLPSYHTNMGLKIFMNVGNIPMNQSLPPNPANNGFMQPNPYQAGPPPGQAGFYPPIGDPGSTYPPFGSAGIPSGPEGTYPPFGPQGPYPPGPGGAYPPGPGGPYPPIGPGGPHPSGGPDVAYPGGIGMPYQGVPNMPYQGGPGMPQQGGPAMPFQGAPSGPQYPPNTGQYVPSAPNSSNDEHPKAQESAQQHSNQPQREMPPPSYDSLSFNR